MANSGSTSSSDSIFSVFFFILIIAYIIYMYINENDNPTTTNPLNYVFWLIIVIGEFLWGALSYLSGIPQSRAFTNSAIAVFTTWTVLFLPMFTMNDSTAGKFIGLDFAQELNSIFSNVIGYFWVSRQATDILSKLNAINIHNIDGPKNPDLVAAQILYSEIKNNKTLIINQLTPSNFDCQWDTLFKYLFTIAGETDLEKKGGIRDQLKSVVLRKYAMGKCFWYFYTAIVCYSLSIYFMSIL